MGFVSSIGCTNAYQESKDSRNIDVELILQRAKNVPLEKFSDLIVWKRNEGYVIDSVNNNFRLFILQKEDSLLIKRIFPEQDTIFFPLDAIYSTQQRNRLEFSELINHFKKLDFDKIISIKSDLVILLVREDINVLYSKNNLDDQISERFRKYTKYDQNWYFYINDK